VRNPSASDENKIYTSITISRRKLKSDEANDRQYNRDRSISKFTFATKSVNDGKSAKSLAH
jgi:hypothetical protein